jgi:hypothetical protein
MAAQGRRAIVEGDLREDLDPETDKRTHPSRMAATERSRAKAQFKARLTSL